jgi:diaminohydroxyphosphoribosylaminopyrimidine deaminase/5-amino-6-(5-phosphoribosylamino)uracil reductase
LARTHHTRALALNAPFTRFIRTGLPLITFKAAVSLDGKVAAAGGDARWISSAESRRRVHLMRATADAVVVGAGTLRRDDPELTVRDAPGRDPIRVIVSRSGELPLAAKALSGGGPATIVLTERIPADVEATLRERGVECVVTGPEGLSRGLAALAKRGLLDILLEGGPTLAGSLLDAGLIDRVAFFVAPLIVGRGAPDLFAAPASRSLVDAWRLEDVEWTTSGADGLVTGRIALPAPLAQKES